MKLADTIQGYSQALPPPVWRRLGIAGFIFFFVKGLLWLAAPAIFYIFS